MRVLLVTLAVFGGNKKGGGERYVTELARALQSQGTTVKIVVVNGLWSFAEQVNMHIPPTSVPYAHFLKMVREADVIHVHQLNTPGFDHAVLASRMYKKPIVLTDHGGGSLTPGRLLGRARLGLVDAAGFVSEWSKRDVDPHGVIKKNTIILGGGDHLPSSPSLPELYDFGFIGRFLPHKGAHIAIEALPAGASIVLAGQVRDELYFQKLKQLARGKRVTFVTDASDEFVASLRFSIRYLLVPSVETYQHEKYSRPELLGLVALEALAAGTPVIGSDVGGLAEVLRAADQLILPPGDVPAWTSGLSNVMNRPAPSFETVEFKWDAVASKCIVLYRAALAARTLKKDCH
ncbi:glycosyltransferase involved in cell wall biosynthesis [Rhodoligotrophos appendicifer]|uniref:glycosyltransferase family 4 protein n=1 Tax=Rhodoligotrophos appendicifer TaxID=987056 RepID=UPI0011868662|nr:glycosyltransferase family 4 protein [Rhodoligotrophos appendicifer]